jgi:hypothetical protein
VNLHGLQPTEPDFGAFIWFVNTKVPPTIKTGDNQHLGDSRDFNNVDPIAIRERLTRAFKLDTHTYVFNADPQKGSDPTSYSIANQVDPVNLNEGPMPCYRVQ